MIVAFKRSPKWFMPPATTDAVVAMYEAMIGRPLTAEEKIAMRAKCAAVEARRARDRLAASRPHLRLPPIAVSANR